MSLISLELVMRHLEVASPKDPEVVKPVLSQNKMQCVLKIPRRNKRGWGVQQ